TARLTNASPLVMNVVAAGGTDFSVPPLYSPIASATAGPSTNVLTPPIGAPIGTLLYAWAKNEDSANATALDGYVVDAQSTAFLWAEAATAGSTGQYSGHFS